MTQLFPCLMPTSPDGEWCILNRFRSGTGRCGVTLTDNPLCVCGATQTMSHIVDSCPVYKFEGSLASLHKHLIPRWSGCATAAYAKERKNERTNDQHRAGCYLSPSFLVRSLFTSTFYLVAALQYGKPSAEYCSFA